MTTIAVIGLGLIGTSLGLALRTASPQQSAFPSLQVVGYDRRHEHLQGARGRLAIDRAADSLANAVRGAQLVVIATPVQSVRPILGELAGLLPAGTVVTDTASTKAEVMNWAAELLPAACPFVGGHPMAGREHSGPEAADPELFRDSIYCLCAPPTVPTDAIALVEAMVQTIGAKPYYIDPIEHDAYVAGVSHLPFLLSTLLVEVTTRSPAWREMAPIAASGFRDISRLASGDPVMHRDIAITNRAALIRWIDDLFQALIRVREQLDQHDDQGLLALFEQAHTAREAWLKTRPGQRPGEEQQRMPAVEQRSLLGRIVPLPRSDRERGKDRR